jgi:hypothetical protein
MEGMNCLPVVLYLHRFEHLKLWYELRLSQISGTQLFTVRNMKQESTSAVTIHLDKDLNSDMYFFA